MAATDAYLFGRKTYEKMAAYWLAAPEDAFARHLNRTRKYVASTTLQRVTWQNASLLGPDVAGDVATLKEEPGRNITVLGSGQLVQTLIERDLVDEFFLAVFPLSGAVNGSSAKPLGPGS